MPLLPDSRLYLPTGTKPQRRAGWLVPGDNCTALEYAIVLRALDDVGILERPLGSNRGIRIDMMTRWSGLKPPQYWCAIWVGYVMASCGALVPRGFPSCDRWLPFMTKEPRVGGCVLYGKPGDATHIEIVVRVESDIILTCGGNRSYTNINTNNGTAVDIGPLVRRDVLGYVHAMPGPTTATG